MLKISADDSRVVSNFIFSEQKKKKLKKDVGKRRDWQVKD